MNEIIDLLMKFLGSEFFAILASISSIISLILMFYVFLDVRKIKNDYRIKEIQEARKWKGP